MLTIPHRGPESNDPLISNNNNEKSYLIEYLFRNILQEDENEEEFTTSLKDLWSNKNVTRERFKKIMLDRLSGLPTEDSAGMAWLQLNIDTLNLIKEDEEGNEYMINKDGSKDYLKYSINEYNITSSRNINLKAVLEKIEDDLDQSDIVLKPAEIYSNIIEFHTCIDNKELTKSQKIVLEYIANEGPDKQLMIYITGGAGVGKSYLLNKINILYETIWHKNVKITALTGVAAILVKGTTVHSAFRINDELEE